MSAERGPSRGGTTLARRSFSQERMTMSRSSIGSERSRSFSISSRINTPHHSSFSPRSEGSKKATMSRAEFTTKYRPFIPSQDSYRNPEPFQKTQQLLTRPFSTYRDGATMTRSAINRAKGEISTNIINKKPQFDNTERPKISLIKKINLEKKHPGKTIFERPKVSLIKPVSLEKREIRENEEVSLRKKVRLEKRNRPQQERKKVSFIKRINLEKKTPLRHFGEEERRIQNLLGVAQQLDIRNAGPRQHDEIKRSLSFRVKNESRNLMPQKLLNKERSLHYANASVGPSTLRKTHSLRLEEMTTERTVQRPIEQPKQHFEKQQKPKEYILFESASNKNKPPETTITSWENTLVAITFQNQTHIMEHREFLKWHARGLKNESYILTFNLSGKPLTFHSYGYFHEKDSRLKQQEKLKIKQKEEEEWSEPRCCNHYSTLDEQNNGIGTCPKSGIMFTYDTNAIEKARRENRRVRRSDWNVRNTFILNVAYIQKNRIEPQKEKRSKLSLRN